MHAISYGKQSHHEPPREEPSKRKRQATAGGAGKAEPSEAGTKSKTGTPKPTARAAEPQEPEPKPRNEPDGTTLAGQAVEGKTTNKPELAATH